MYRALVYMLYKGFSHTVNWFIVRAGFLPRPLAKRLERLLYHSFLNRYIFKLPQEPIVTIRPGLQMWLHPEEHPHSGYLGSYPFGLYERGTVLVFERVLREGMTVVDVGAHLGYFTLLAARAVGGRGRVYAFEAVPDNFSLLVKNIELNGCGYVTPVLKAVSSTTGTTQFYLSEKLSSSGSLFGHAGSRTIMVDTTSLDDFFEKEGWPLVHLMKMDIEGAEMFSIAGARKFFARNRDLKLVTECSPGRLERAGVKVEAFLDCLRALGFRVSVIGEKGDLRPVRLPELYKLAKEPGRYRNLFCERS